MPKEKINSVGIVGGGKMGKSIFNHLFKYPYQIVWLNIDDTDGEKKRLKNKLNRLFKHGIITEENLSYESKRVIISNALEELCACDLVIECISEDIHIKNNLFEKLNRLLKRDAVLVSNSSSIKPDAFNISETTKAHFAGMHFFFPVETNKLLEIIPAKEMHKDCLNLLISFAQSIDKYAFVQNTRSAFAINRFFLEIQSSVFNFCVQKKIAFSTVDKVICTHLFPAGIFETMDMIGFNILQYAIGNYLPMHENPAQIKSLLDFLGEKIAKGETGEKGKHGFLKYPLQEIAISDDLVAEIINHVNGIFCKFALQYIEKGIFTHDEMAMVIAEITGTDYNPLKN